MPEYPNRRSTDFGIVGGDVVPELAAFGNIGFTRLDDKIAGGLFAQLKEQS